MKIKTQLKINGELKDVEIENGEITIIEPEPKKKATGWEKVKYANTYYYDSSGLIYDTIESICENHTINYNNANYFSNMKLAENVSRMQTLQRQIFRWQAENDIPINLNSGNYIVYDLDNNEFNVCSIYTKLHSFLPYFSSRNKAIECITEFENELRWLFTEFQWRIDYDNNSTPHKESSVNKND